MPLATGSQIEPSPIPLLRFVDVPHPERHVARGSLVRLRHGVYVSTGLWTALAPWEQYLARVHAVGLVHPDAIFCNESAAAFQKIPIFGDPVVVHVLAPTSGASRLIAGVRTHTSVGDRALLEAGGYAMTTPAETAVDLARHRHPAVGLAVADAALRHDPELSSSTLTAINEGRAGSRGRNMARWPLANATAEAETALESVSRAVIGWLGFAAPELQAVFATAEADDRVDFVWREAGIAGESDGDIKYDGRFGDPVAVLRRQSDRDSRLRRHIRTVTHWGWREATTVTPLRDILSGAGLRPIESEDSARLYQLKRHLAARAPHRTAAG